MTSGVTIETLLRRDRLIVIAGLTAVTLISWIYLLIGAGMEMSAFEMTHLSRDQMAGNMNGLSMVAPLAWTPGYAVLMFFMWWIMMIAMMLPSASPMILLFTAISRSQREAGNPATATGMFALGYLAAWAAFSLVAITLQWGLERSGILSPMLVTADAVFGSFLLLAAGLYQFTAIKSACLRQCRSPLAFLGTHWRRGQTGAFFMGLAHGAYCVGCCWFLMGLLFFGGVMNLYCIAIISLFVLLEKTLPAGHWPGHATGAVLILWGTGRLLLT